MNAQPAFLALPPVLAPVIAQRAKIKMEHCMFKRLLLAFDGSTHSRKALSYAMRMAEVLHAELWILHAYAPVTSSSPLDDVDEFLDLEKAEALRIMSPAMINAERTGVIVHPAIVEGPPAEAIVRVAAEQGCDLIIMGRRGLSPMGQTLLGSVSDHVLNLTDVPILITHATTDEAVN